MIFHLRSSAPTARWIARPLLRALLGLAVGYLASAGVNASKLSADLQRALVGSDGSA